MFCLKSQETLVSVFSSCDCTNQTCILFPGFSPHLPYNSCHSRYMPSQLNMALGSGVFTGAQENIHWEVQRYDGWYNNLLYHSRGSAGECGSMGGQCWQQGRASSFDVFGQSR